MRYAAYSAEGDPKADLDALWAAYTSSYRKGAPEFYVGLALGVTGVAAVVTGVVMIAVRLSY
jgi:hypothetical protein